MRSILSYQQEAFVSAFIPIASHPERTPVLYDMLAVWMIVDVSAVVLMTLMSNFLGSVLTHG